MGRLKPNTPYIYEKSGGITYARERGTSVSERFEIGRDYEIIARDERLMWNNIIEESKRNPALQETLERAKMLYYLSKKNDS